MFCWFPDQFWIIRQAADRPTLASLLCLRFCPGLSALIRFYYSDLPNNGKVGLIYVYMYVCSSRLAFRMQSSLQRRIDRKLELYICMCISSPCCRTFKVSQFKVVSKCRKSVDFSKTKCYYTSVARHSKE